MRYLLSALIIALATIVPLTAQEATPQPIEPVARTVTIWLPADIFSPTDTNTLDIFTAQIQAFMDENPNITVEWRFKRVGEIGGVLSTLRTASAVAPGALPDITLMRRQDLINAQRGGLLQSWEGLLPSALLLNLQQRLIVGQVDEELYGLPYTLDVLHLVYHGQEGTYPNWSYNDVLERRIPLVVPLGRASGLPSIVYAQYRANGASLSPEGLPQFDADALMQTLDFYQQLRAEDLINLNTLDFNTTTDYLPAVEIDTERIFLLSSTQYLSLQNAEIERHIAPLPTANGEPATILNGWMWTLVANTAEQRQIAATLVDWLSKADHQAPIAQSINRLPSQPNALGQVIISRADREIFTALMDNAYLPLTDGEGDTFSRAFGDAIASIMRDERTATQALSDIQRELGE